MATTEQIKALIKAHYDQDNERFKTTALRIAASETRNGDVASGREITAMVDAFPHMKDGGIKGDLFIVSLPETPRMKDLVFPDEVADKLQRVVFEDHQRGKIEAYGLSRRRKILIEGPRGTGKTATAAALAAKLGLPLLTVKPSETAGNLQQIFKTVANCRGVYLFDEFDVKGVFDPLLWFIKEDVSESIIVATTRNKETLDQDMLYCFDDVMCFKMPTVEQTKQIVANCTGGYDPDFTLGDKVAADLSKLCPSDIIRICKDAMKDSLLGDFPLFDELFERACADRLSVYNKHKSETGESKL